MTNDINRRLQEIFAAVLRLPPGTDVTGVAQESEPSWDSLAHVNLIAAMESEFEITIDLDTALEVTSFSQARRAVESRAG
jgi:acyl carrier protein